MAERETHSASGLAYGIPVGGADGKLATSWIPDVPPSGAAGGDLTGTYPNPTLAVARQPSSEKDQPSGYAGLNASSRTTKGAIAADDFIVTNAAKGFVLKDTDGHYWRVTISTLGALTPTDLGTSPP